ncbi:MAG: hypothetical protein AVDCRST_MAG88-938, partial [uncultured Thermomicrobiales bacterium]
ATRGDRGRRPPPALHPRRHARRERGRACRARHPWHTV